MRDTRRTRVVLALLLLTAFTLVTLDYRSGGSGSFATLRSVGSTVFGPLESAAGAVVRPVRSAISSISSIGSNNKKIKNLQSQVDALQEQLRTEPFDQARVNQLNELLHVSALGQYKMVPAQVVAIGGTLGFEWTATIDAGSKDGIKPDMTVLNGNGLVGRVKVVGPTTSTILLAIDPESHVGVRLESGEIGYVDGRGLEDMTLTVPNSMAKLEPGQQMVTLGSTGNVPYVQGVPVGTIVSVQGGSDGLAKTATVRPYVNYTSLDIVGVVVEPPRVDPRFALLEPPPAATPSTPPATTTPPASPTTTPSP